MNHCFNLLSTKVRLLEKQIKKYLKKSGKKFNEGRITKSKKTYSSLRF